MRKALSVLVVCIIHFSGYGQVDTTMLLSNPGVQIEATDAINNMYNFKFDKAEAYFLQIAKKYPNHPMPPFLMGLSNWWKMMPYIDNADYTNTFEKEFLYYIDISIEKGEKLFKENDQNIEAAFFLCAAHGFKGRYYSENKGYVKAAFEGKSALHYLNYTKGKGNMSPEFLFGESIFNYYSEWIKDEYPLLKPLVALFPKGNKQTGLFQLKECATNAFYTRIEAQYFLLRIYNNEENNTRAAYPYAKYLSESFPDNPYFQRVYARLTWELGYYDVCEKTCYDINYKVNIGMPGYEENTGRQACYFLGRLLYEKSDMEKSKFYLLKTAAFAEAGDMNKMGYSLSANYYLGMIEKRTGNLEEAKKFLLKVMEYGEDKSDNSAVYNYSYAAYQLGDVYESNKDYKAAEQSYKTAMKRVEKLDETIYAGTIAEIKKNSTAGLERVKKIKK